AIYSWRHKSRSGRFGPEVQSRVLLLLVGYLRRGQEARAAGGAGHSASLAPHLTISFHMLDQKVAVLVVPIGDGPKFLDDGLAVFNHDNRPISNQCIVNSKELFAPPHSFAEGMSTFAVFLHRSQNRFGFHCTGLLGSCLPKVHDRGIFPAYRTPLAWMTFAVFSIEAVGVWKVYIICI